MGNNNQPPAEVPRLPLMPIGPYFITLGTFTYLDLSNEKAIVIHFFGGDALKLTPAESAELKQRLGIGRIEAPPAGGGIGSLAGR